MHFSILTNALVAGLCVSGALSQSATSPSAPNPTDILTGPRTENILADIAGFIPLPSLAAILASGLLNTRNIQADVVVGMKKKMEIFYFFKINATAVSTFKKALHDKVSPKITSALDILDVSTQPIVALNVAFSRGGMVKLGQSSNLGDSVWAAGQFSDANNLGDPGTTNWVPEFKDKSIDGVFLIASDSQLRLDAQVTVLESWFGSSMTKRYSLQGGLRPPPFVGHEMFGFLDGIAQPALIGFNLLPKPGQHVVPPGMILTGNLGDDQLLTRPLWTHDGSFMAFRQLKQLVPEFNKFLVDNAPSVPGKTQAQSAELLGARMVGRWKSGAPVDLSPMNDDPALGANPDQNNNFNYVHAGFDFSKDQSHCPFAAHIRKTRPRADVNEANAIMRAGIPYGPEVTPAENSAAVSSTAANMERGLAFVAYMSDIDKGFHELQIDWANDPDFAPGKNVTPGYDPIIGANHGNTRFMNGYNINDASRNLTLEKDFVVSRGGEYFFVPSIAAIRDVLSV